MTATTRYWLHDAKWRIQEACQIADRQGVMRDGWRSLAKDGQVLLFDTEELAREYHEANKSTEK